MVVSDFRINSGVRSCLARHWIDLQQLSFGSFRGVVRISGKLCHLGEGPAGALRGGDVDALEEEIRRIPGVQNVFFELANWKKASSGQWEGLDRSIQGDGVGGTEGLAQKPIVLEFRTNGEPAQNSEKTTPSGEREKP